MGGAKSSSRGRVSQDEEEFEVLDVRGTAQSTMSWLQQYLLDLTREPVAKQVAVGGATGWAVGFLSMKVGKVAATVLGGSLLVMQIAAHKGYIKVDWNRVNKDIEKSARKIQDDVKSRVNSGVGDERLHQETLDHKLEKAVEKLEKQVNKLEGKADTWLDKKFSQAKRAYRHHVLGDKRKETVDELYLLNMYILAFSAGTMLGVGVGKLL
ncbi:FUN14 domain-containing protein 1 [Oratosquilla oratoria]|uniref:FUN14 domain-containing protein 1 n=1 Tax=Oratosquilla oratoria TaxID=337810 RepID=UPI003F7758EC